MFLAGVNLSMGTQAIHPECSATPFGSGIKSKEFHSSQTRMKGGDFTGRVRHLRI
jgi:hypothetical protein